MRLSTIALGALAFATPLMAQTADRSTRPLAPALQAALDRGATLYILDEAAWHGSDDLRDHFPALLARAGGYVVTGNDAAANLVFYDKAGKTAVYRATYSAGRKVASGPPSADRVALTAMELRLIAARPIAIAAFAAANVTPCNAIQPNLAMLPPIEPGGTIRAYMMTARTSMASLPLGGHYEVDIASDGHAGKVRSFMKSCMEMPLPGKGPKTPLALMVSHLLDDTPTEMHVFSSLTGHVPIYVMTASNERLWAVEGGSIRDVTQQRSPNAGRRKR